jgi:hypothetical protein
LLAVAIFGAVALGIYDRSLDQELAQTTASAGLRQAVDAARGQFVATMATDAGSAARTIVRTSLAWSIEIMMLFAAALAVCSAVSGILLPRQTTEQH